MSLNKHQSGFTLLEVLVAIVVVSLGLLGLAGLQAATLRNNQIAYYRAIAIQQTYDMADRIRANQDGASTTVGAYDNLTATIPTAPNCFTGTCSPAQMAVADHSQWNSNNRDMLPMGRGTVVAIAGGTFDITVMMAENELGGATDPNCPAGTPANFRCFVTRVAP